jgi:hypothetical protein
MQPTVTPATPLGYVTYSCKIIGYGGSIPGSLLSSSKRSTVESRKVTIGENPEGKPSGHLVSSFAVSSLVSSFAVSLWPQRPVILCPRQVGSGFVFPLPRDS